MPAQAPEHLQWKHSATGIEQLVLWLQHAAASDHPPAETLPVIFKWLRWAAGLPRLRLVELRVSSQHVEVVGKPRLLCMAARAEDENVEGMLFRFGLDLADAF